MKMIDAPTPVADPVIAEVRRHKREIAAAFDFDVVALGRSLQARQAGDPRFVNPSGEQGGADQPATAVDSKSEGGENAESETDGRSQ